MSTVVLGVIGLVLLGTPEGVPEAATLNGEVVPPAEILGRLAIGRTRGRSRRRFP